MAWLRRSEQSLGLKGLSLPGRKPERDISLTLTKDHFFQLENLSRLIQEVISYAWR